MIWKLFIFTESIAIIMVLTADVLCLKKGYRPAGYYLIAWTFLLSGGMLLILKGVSVVPSNFITENSMAIGSAMEVILLSLGLADRINELKRQNELTRIKNQEELQKLNDELEQKVMERTTQVNEMLDQVGKLYLDSENKRMEIENLAESRKKLSLVGQMAAGIVHDIKNPMATIKSLAEMLNSDSISQQRKTKNLNLIVREMDRLSDLSYEILDFSKGHLNLNLKEVNLKEFIYEIEQFLKIDFDYANVKCILDIQYGESISIDRDRMRRVFINIAKNAIEAMYDGQKDYSLTIRSEKQDDRVMLYFIDNGNGLPKSVEERLFEAFTTEGKTKGTGLGLYMCKWIVESHNGELTYKTKSGEGTTFFISLPIE
jgi:signal transduction histidine kinase